ncbi:uncharacterized protein LOC123221558 [Mangifera indica]|uniref:uncharacterized protein LOC123221558 n=1 Tax=Mangifera indica TaxID=29780 RepID=UPI001CFBD88F|nr:uncharacterized protein LOC123221558 [Mangifera indica]
MLVGIYRRSSSSGLWLSAAISSGYPGQPGYRNPSVQQQPSQGRGYPGQPRYRNPPVQQQPSQGRGYPGYAGRAETLQAGFWIDSTRLTRVPSIKKKKSALKPMEIRSAVFKKDFVVAPASEAELTESKPAKSSACCVAKIPYNVTAQDLPSSLKPPKKRLKPDDYGNDVANSTSGTSGNPTPALPQRYGYIPPPPPRGNGYRQPSPACRYPGQPGHGYPPVQQPPKKNNFGAWVGAGAGAAAGLMGGHRLDRGAGPPRGLAAAVWA